eukprot:CAMPEP_0168495060 /NCGR_PEP_ID=MMETSP0228-20121227/71545_1 /TAXON_ID=133427 /ORGANISM="Protoceratium reticulatum, Strain CCCM 535 (=CCMP 1889)" /LENGTH=295 /DNA_ID=CAMNT_0008511873 /DNA_START=36 /DNA_END=920 /DNA_ORIENTATION=+
MMQSEATRSLLKDPRLERPGLRLIELQRAVWDPLGVDRDVGCQHLDQLDKAFPGDKELGWLRDHFIHTAQRTYLLALRDRRPATLERKKQMQRETVIEFFDACNTMMDLPETYERLTNCMMEKKQVPNQEIIQMQREMLEVLGFEQDHGCTVLSRVLQDYPDDKELRHRFQVWQQKAQQTCMLVVKKHQMSGGEMPDGPFGVSPSPEMAEMSAEAKKGLETMTPAQRGELVQRMQKKLEVFMKLPPEGRLSHLKKLPEAERLEFLQGQILMVSIMKDQWRAQQQPQPGSQHQHEH